MSERYFTYERRNPEDSESHSLSETASERDGETLFAVWSTVVEGVTWYDMTREEFEDWYVEREAEKAREYITERADALESGENPYCGLLADVPPNSVVEKLKTGEEL